MSIRAARLSSSGTSGCSHRRQPWKIGHFSRNTTGQDRGAGVGRPPRRLRSAIGQEPPDLGPGPVPGGIGADPALSRPDVRRCSPRHEDAHPCGVIPFGTRRAASEPRSARCMLSARPDRRAEGAARTESSGAVPLIADDVLIPFDDRRTAAALQALAGLRARTRRSYSHIRIMSASWYNLFCNMISSSSIGSRVEHVASQWAEMSRWEITPSRSVSFDPIPCNPLYFPRTINFPCNHPYRSKSFGSVPWGVVAVRSRRRSGLRSPIALAVRSELDVGNSGVTII